MKKVIIKKDEIVKGLEKVQKTIGKEGAAKGILFQADGEGKAIMTSQNGKVQTFAIMEATGDELEFLVDGATFSSLISSAATLEIDEFTLEVNDKTLKVKAGDILVTELNLLNPKDFINFDKLEKEKAKFKVKGKDFKSAIKKVKFATAISEERPVLQGIYSELIKDTNQLCLTAIDGYRIAHFEFSVEDLKTDEDISFNIPGSAIDSIKDTFEGDINIKVGDKLLSIETGKTIYKILLIEGQYMNYRQMMPNKFNIKVKTNLKELLNALRVCETVSDPKKKKVTFKVKDETMHVVAEEAKGNVDIKLNVITEGDDVEITLNSNYLKDLAYFDTEEVIINLIDETSPLVVIPTDGSKQLYLLLPIKNK